MIAELLSQVESPEFSARVTVASGFKQFLKAIEATPEVKAASAPQSRRRSLTFPLQMLSRF